MNDLRPTRSLLAPNISGPTEYNLSELWLYLVEPVFILPDRFYPDYAGIPNPFNVPLEVLVPAEPTTRAPTQVMRTQSDVRKSVGIFNGTNDNILTLIGPNNSSNIITTDHIKEAYNNTYNIGNDVYGSIGNNSSIVVNGVRMSSKLCGFPAFCSNKAYDACAKTSLRACADCSQVGMGFFALFVVLLGLACVMGNVLVMAVLKKLGLRQSLNMIKFSLALTDLLTGIQLLVVAIYNFSWSINVTSLELDRRQLSLRGSAEATAGGIFLLLTFTSSLYHLVFMGAQRLYAIKWPMRFRVQKKNSTLIGLIVVWIAAVLSSTVPAWFSDDIVYTYQHTLFLFGITEKTIQKEDDTYSRLIVIMVVVLVLPYLAMTFATFATIFFIRSQTKKSKALKRNGPTNQNPPTTSKREAKIFATVALMQLGFTITMIPLVVISSLFYGNLVTCDTLALPYMLCYYLSMFNSLVNVIVYSLRDDKFMEALKEVASFPASLRKTRGNETEDTGTRSKQIATSSL